MIDQCGSARNDPTSSVQRRHRAGKQAKKVDEFLRRHPTFHHCRSINATMEALWSSPGIEILNGKKRLTLLGSGERDRRLHRNLLQPAKPKFIWSTMRRGSSASYLSRIHPLRLDLHGSRGDDRQGDESWGSPGPYAGWVSFSSALGVRAALRSRTRCFWASVNAAEAIRRTCSWLRRGVFGRR